MMIEQLQKEAIGLLIQLISTPSQSKNEEQTAHIIEDFFKRKNIEVERKKNNVWVKNKYFDTSKPTILLNSHHDTVKPNAGYTRSPYQADIEEGKLYGLGSNDAGGALVSLIATFLYFYEKESLSHNLILLASAEEEISGYDGVALVYPILPKIEFAIVGEPTEMNIAIAEKGLMVLDCEATGKSGHAAREEGENALYKAMEDIDWIRNYRFPKKSDTLGEVKMSVTMIESGTQHNVVPDRCRYVVDVRVTDAYTNKEVLETICNHIKSNVTPRSTRLNSSSISKNHPFVQVSIEDGALAYGSPTMSDQALLNVASLKMGPGKSERSHTADEYIYISEIENAISSYIYRIENYLKLTT